MVSAFLQCLEFANDADAGRAQLLRRFFDKPACRTARATDYGYDQPKRLSGITALFRALTTGGFEPLFTISTHRHSHLPSCVAIDQLW